MVLAKIPFERQFDIQPPADCRLQSRGHSAHWDLMKSTQSSDHRLCILVGHANNVITLWCEDEHLYFSSHEAARIAEAMAWTETIGWLARSILRVQSHSNGQSNHLFNLLPFRDGPLTPCDPDLRLIRLSFRSVHNRRPDADGHRPQAVRVSCVSTGAAFRMAPPPDAPKTGVMSIEDWAGLDREPMPSAEGDPDSVDIPMGGVCAPRRSTGCWTTASKRRRVARRQPGRGARPRTPGRTGVRHVLVRPTRPSNGDAGICFR